MEHTHVSCSLHRLDNTTWSYQNDVVHAQGIQEVRIHVDLEHILPKQAYSIASSVAQIFSQHPETVTQEQLEKGININIVRERVTHPTHGRWNISAIKAQKSWMNSIPFFRSIPSQSVLEVRVSKVSSSIWECVSKIFTQQTECRDVGPLPKKIESPLHPLSQSTFQRALRPLFEDPFTELATACFATAEPFFIMEQEHRGSWRFIVDEKHNKVCLKKHNPTIDGHIQAWNKVQNRAAVEKYKLFLEQEHGPWILPFLAKNYDLDLDIMIRDGLPLLPDHVSKCNIAAQNIDIGHVYDLTRSLFCLLRLLEETAEMTLEQCIDERAQEHNICLSTSEWRGLIRATRKNSSSDEISLNDMKEYLNQLLMDNDPKESIKESLSLCHKAASILMPTCEERELGFTGRKIRHLAIMGFPTMGRKEIPCAARDMFELLHIFQDLENAPDWPSYHELLSHVVAKKELFRQWPSDAGVEDSTWKVGLLLPAPKNLCPNISWYYNSEFSDDGHGNVNYTLLPLMNIKPGENIPYPMIKLYRSTASSGNALDWHDSIQADLNPHGSPGSLAPEYSYKYEKGMVQDRTIPLWVAYTLAATHELDACATRNIPTAKVKQYFSRALYFFQEYYQQLNLPERIEEDLLSPLQDLFEGKEYKELEQHLTDLMYRYNEHPERKISQDIVFVGHSLGGSLAQFSSHFFGPKVGRIPMPHCNFMCYSSDAPAIDTKDAQAFMEFGRANRKLLMALDQQWKVFHQFEYGDIVPQFGESHLGTNNYDGTQDADWLKFKGRIFQPLPSAQSLSITTAPTHGRRIGTALEDRDYILKSLTPQEIYDADHSYFVRPSLAKKFGNSIFKSPKALEKSRQIAATVLYPANRFVNWALGRKGGARDLHGVFYTNDI